VETLEQDLPASQGLGFHYTDLDSARIILATLGVRASSVGQLAGGVSVCLATPADFGWDKYGSSKFARKVGDELWGSKWYEVMPKPAPAGEHADWGKWAKKREVLLILRIPAAENRDESRIVPGRPNVYIIPDSDCVPGRDGDTLSYYSNTNIEKVLILTPPTGHEAPQESAGAKLLDDLVCKGKSEQVYIESDRDDDGGMADVALTIVPAESYAKDLIKKEKDGKPLMPWSWEVACTSATITAPPDPANLYIDRHRRLQTAEADRKHWPEDIARFTSKEMEAALHSIKQQQLRSYTLAFLYTTKAQAVEMCQKGRGVASSCMVTTQSPVDLGWEKNAGGRFMETASRVLGQHADSFQAVLVLGVPASIVHAQTSLTASHSLTIPQELLMEVGDEADAVHDAKPHKTEAERTFVYANAHVHKSYVLIPAGAHSVAPVAGKQATTQALFEKAGAGVNGVAAISRQPPSLHGLTRQPPSLRTAALAARAMTPPRGGRRAPPPLELLAEKHGAS
jgi:hypothetical protein